LSRDKGETAIASDLPRQDPEQILFASLSFQPLRLDAALGRFLLPQQIESNVAQDSQVPCAIAFENLTFIFSKGNI
jgi:hypothetical protein